MAFSTEALLDCLGSDSYTRTKIFSSHRPQSITHAGVVIRDQKPMNHNLERCLLDKITPQAWFEFLNRKVFFWTCTERLMKFRRAYKFKRQLILEVPTQRMIEAHAGSINLCPINSGATKMPDQFRSFATFQEIASFSHSSKKRPAEFTVDYAVKDIVFLALTAYKIEGDQKVVLH